MMVEKLLLLLPLVVVELCAYGVRAIFLVVKRVDPLTLVWGMDDANPFHPRVMQFFVVRRNLRDKFWEPAQTFNSVDALCRETAYFSSDDERFDRRDFPTPPIVQVDDFYDDPAAIRQLALSKEYTRYGRDWYSSALWVRAGLRLEGDDYFHGFRHNDDAVVRKLSGVLGAEIDMETWESMGDGWNGAFHYKSENSLTRSDAIHHHWKPMDVPYGWSGVLYLNDDDVLPPNTGTSIWRDRETGKCIAPSFAPFFDRNTGAPRWEMVFDVEPKFNRLILFRSDIFHMAGMGFGNALSDARLFQTFFFCVRKSG